MLPKTLLPSTSCRTRRWAADEVRSYCSPSAMSQLQAAAPSRRAARAMPDRPRRLYRTRSDPHFGPDLSYVAVLGFFTVWAIWYSHDK